MQRRLRLLRIVGVVGLLVTLMAATITPAGAQPNPNPSPGQDATLLDDPGLTLDTNTIYFPWVANDDDFGLGPADTSITVQNLEDLDTYIYIYKGTGAGWELSTTAYLAAWASKTFTADSLGFASGEGAPVAVSAYRGGLCVTDLGPGGVLSAGRDINGNGTCSDYEVLVTLFDESPITEEVDVCVAKTAGGGNAPYWDSSLGLYLFWDNVEDLEAEYDAGGEFGGLNNDGDCTDAEGGSTVYPTIIGGYAKTAVDGETLPYTTVADTAVSGYNSINGWELGTFDQWYLPIVQTNCGPGGCWDTVIRAANYSTTNSAITLRFFPSDDGSGSLQTGFQLEFLVNAGQTISVVLSDRVPEGWVGSVHAYSDSEMMLMADRFKVGYHMWLTNTGSSADFEWFAQIPGGLGNYVLFAPDVRLDYFGWNTGINIANLVEMDNNVTAQYFNLFGNATGTRSQRLAPHGMTYFYDPSQLPQDNSSQIPSDDLNADIIGSALIWSDYPVAVAVDATKYPESTTELDENVFQGMTYSATANVYTWQAFPLVQKGNPPTGMGATSGINMMNPNAVATQALVYWVNQSGFGADNFGTTALAIPGFANGFVYTLAQHNIPNGFYGAALVTSTYPVAATTANVDYQVQYDGSVIWNGFNPCGFYRSPDPALECYLGDPFAQPEGGSVKKLFVDEFGEPVADVWVDLFNTTAYQRYVLGDADYPGIPWVGQGVSDVNGEILWTNVPEGDYWLEVVRVPDAPTDIDGLIEPAYVQILEAQGAMLLGPWLESFRVNTGQDVVVTNVLENAVAIKIVQTNLPATGPTDGAGGVYSGVYIFEDQNCDAVLDKSDLGFGPDETVSQIDFFRAALTAKTVDADGEAIFALGDGCFFAFVSAPGYAPQIDPFELVPSEIELNVIGVGRDGELAKHVCERANEAGTACDLDGGNEIQRIEPIVPFPLISCYVEIGFDGETAFNIPCNVGAENLKDALVDQLPNINEEDIEITGGPLTDYDTGIGAPLFIEFTGQYADQNVPQLTLIQFGGGSGGEVSTVREGGSGLQIPLAIVRVWVALPFSEITADLSANTTSWGENVVADGHTDGAGVFTTQLPPGRYIVCAIGFDQGFSESCEFVDIVSEETSTVVNVLLSIDEGPVTPPPPPPVGDGTITKYVCREDNLSDTECDSTQGGVQNEIIEIDQVDPTPFISSCQFQFIYGLTTSAVLNCINNSATNAVVETTIENMLVAAGHAGAQVTVTGGPIAGAGRQAIQVEFVGSLAGVDIVFPIFAQSVLSAIPGDTTLIQHGGNQPPVNKALAGATVQIWQALPGTVLGNEGTYGTEVTLGPQPTDGGGRYVSPLLLSGRYVLCAAAPGADGECEFVDINDDDPFLLNRLNVPGTISVVFGDVQVQDEVQSMFSFFGAQPSSGTYTIEFCFPDAGTCETTAAIAFNATLAQIQAALEALSLIDPGDVTVSGISPPNPFNGVVFTFGGQYAATNLPLMTVTSSFDTNLYFMSPTVEGLGTAQQVLTADALVSGGTFLLQFDGEWTNPIAWNATAAQIATALNALSTITSGGGSVVGLGGPINTTPVILSATGVAGFDTNLLVVDSSNLD